MCGVNHWHFIKDFGSIVVDIISILLRKMSPRAIGFEPEVHPITDIEASLLFIAHSKQYQACRQVLSICILSAHRSTHVLISRCRSMATDLEIICLSSKQELMADITNRKECFFSQLLKCMQNTSKMLFVLKKNPRINLHVFQICTLINKQSNYSYSDMKPNALPPYLSVKKRSGLYSISTHRVQSQNISDQIDQ